MYKPVQDGIDKTVQKVQYTEALPPSDLAQLVHCFWELKTTAPLAEDFKLHAVPDACVDIMFNELEPQIAGVTSLRTTYEVLNLGKVFHYVGIEFLPGVWQGQRDEIAHEYIGSAYTGSLPLITVNGQMIDKDFVGKQKVMAAFVQQLAAQHVIAVNPLMATILMRLDTINTVSDMAEATGISPRQLQRTLKQITGFSPHDLLKVLRLQQAIQQGYPTLYTDQSHFIHSFKKITGYTPTQYFAKFDV